MRSLKHAHAVHKETGTLELCFAARGAGGKKLRVERLLLLCLSRGEHLPKYNASALELVPCRDEALHLGERLQRECDGDPVALARDDRRLPGVGGPVRRAGPVCGSGCDVHKGGTGEPEWKVAVKRHAAAKGDGEDVLNPWAVCGEPSEVRGKLIEGDGHLKAQSLLKESKCCLGLRGA